MGYKDRYVARLTIQGNPDPPRRLMEEALDRLLRSRKEGGHVTIEFDREQSSITPKADR